MVQKYGHSISFTYIQFFGINIFRGFLTRMGSYFIKVKIEPEQKQCESLGVELINKLRK